MQRNEFLHKEHSIISDVWAMQSVFRQWTNGYALSGVSKKRQPLQSGREKERPQSVIDAEWILRYFGTTHLVAKADRTQKCSEPPKLQIGFEAVETFVEQRWKYRDKNESCRRVTLHLFDEGWSTNKFGQWDDARKDNRMTLVVGQENIFEGSADES
jgi:hypothetical protein